MWGGAPALTALRSYVVVDGSSLGSLLVLGVLGRADRVLVVPCVLSDGERALRLWRAPPPGDQRGGCYVCIPLLSPPPTLAAPIDPVCPGAFCPLSVIRYDGRTQSWRPYREHPLHLVCTCLLVFAIEAEHARARRGCICTLHWPPVETQIETTESARADSDVPSPSGSMASETLTHRDEDLPLRGVSRRASGLVLELWLRMVGTVTSRYPCHASPQLFARGRFVE